MLRDDAMGWTGDSAVAEPVPTDDIAEIEIAAEIVILRRAGRSGDGDALLFVEVRRDLFGDYVVTRCASSTRRKPREAVVVHPSWDEAMIDAGAHIHRALMHGYRVC